MGITSCLCLVMLLIEKKKKRAEFGRLIDGLED